MTEDTPPTYRAIAARTFQAVGPCRIAVLTIHALRDDDMADVGRRATAEQARMRIGTAQRMLAEQFLGFLRLRRMTEPEGVKRARIRALTSLDEVQTSIAGLAHPCNDALPDPEAFRRLCLDRVDPEVTDFLTRMIATFEDAQAREDSQHRNETLRAVSQARSVGRSIQMVALNAAIEASNSGTEGRGFKVIAEEVKTLADRTESILGEVAHGLER